MEALGAFSDGEWDSFTAMFSSQELDQSPFPMGDNNNNAASTELQLPDNGWFYSLDAFDPNLQSDMSLSLSCSSCSTDNSSGSGNAFLFANSSTQDFFMSIDDERNFGSSFLSDVLMGEVDNAPAGCDGLQIPPPPADHSAVAGKEPIALKRKVNNTDFSDTQKKKPRISGPGQKRKKTQKANVEEEGNAAAASEGQSSIGYSSEEENGSPEANGGGGVSGKLTRASRGSATDPQSLYARKRRERINERLKILQKLVPNGTKVDISTMLEEAVHYVKFLQLQIKLLSSDEMWMFAPLAYNGMDLGLHQKLSPFLSH